MQSQIKAQLAAICAILLLSLLCFAPFWVINYPMKSTTLDWNRLIAHKDSMLEKQDQLRGELKAYQQMAEKREANNRFRKNIEGTSLEGVQSILTKFAGITSLKATQEKTSGNEKEIRISFVAPYNVLGSALTELWNTYQFIDLYSLVIKANPSRPDEEVVVTFIIKLP